MCVCVYIYIYIHLYICIYMFEYIGSGKPFCPPSGISYLSPLTHSPTRPRYPGLTRG